MEQERIYEQEDDYKYKFCNCDLEGWEVIVSQKEPDYDYRDVIYYHCDTCGKDFAVVDFYTNEILYYNYGYIKQ